jgi:hypothetical protein
MKVSDLSGVALDWAVAAARIDGAFEFYATPSWSPSTNWSQSGPIIERERIRLDPRGVWVAGHDSSNDEYLGTTPLIAAMRCYVASKLGDDISIPEELI